MAHYFAIHSIDKDLVQGVVVISCLDSERFEDKMTQPVRGKVSLTTKYKDMPDEQQSANRQYCNERSSHHDRT